MSVLLFRCDGNSRIGAGHVMRCLALAQAWIRAGGQVQFALAETAPSLENRLQNEGIGVSRIVAVAGSAVDAQQTAQIGAGSDAEWIVIDGYHFNAAYQLALKSAGMRILVIDDNGDADHYYADLVLNQNLHADASLYKQRESYTHLMLGPRFALIRRQYLDCPRVKREIRSVASRVLVTFGGADPENATGQVVDWLAGMDIQAKIVVGGSNVHRSQIEETAKKHGDRMTVVVDAEDMPALMTWAEVAIAAGGTTVWELSYMGLPAIVLALADNQLRVVATLDSRGVARHVTLPQLIPQLNALLNDGECRHSMSECGKALVDGGGADRVMAYLYAGSLEMRRMRPEDSRLVWQWSNDPATRAASFSAAPIPWTDHEKWFADRMASSTCLFYLALNRQGVPIGQIRYDLDGEEAVVSLSLDKAVRGQGYGAALILRGTGLCFDQSPASLIKADVKKENVASSRAFLSAGFEDRGAIGGASQPAHQFVIRREYVQW